MYILGQPKQIKIPFMKKLNNNITEQINIFSYLGCPISHQNEKDIIVKISQFLQITGIINRPLIPSEVQKHTRCEVWAIREQDISRMAVEMKFMRTMGKHT